MSHSSRIEKNSTDFSKIKHWISIEAFMKLLNTYEDRDEAEDAERRLVGGKRLASERDATVVIYNLFGCPSWGNFHRLGMYRLVELQELLRRRDVWGAADRDKHQEILSTLASVAKNYGISVPLHWF